MAIDFPNSPSVGQTYSVGNRTWKWDGTTWAVGTGAPALYVQDAVPASPIAGDQWYESDTGRWLIYYDNAWVEITTAGTVITNANDLTGTTLASNVVSSSLTSFGTSPAFTGTPTAPTASAGTNTTQIATMASRPWNTAWGLVTYTTSTSNTITSNVVSGLTTTFTATSNRRYKITTHLTTSVASGRHIITTNTTSLGNHRTQDLSEIGYPHAEGSYVVTGNGTSQTVTVTIGTVSGTINLASDDTTNKHFLLIEDIGGV